MLIRGFRAMIASRRHPAQSSLVNAEASSQTCLSIAFTFSASHYLDDLELQQQLIYRFLSCSSGTKTHPHQHSHVSLVSPRGRASFYVRHPYHLTDPNNALTSRPCRHSDRGDINFTYVRLSHYQCWDRRDNSQPLKSCIKERFAYTSSKGSRELVVMLDLVGLKAFLTDHMLAPTSDCDITRLDPFSPFQITFIRHAQA